MSDYIKREDAYEVLTNLYHHQTETQHRALREALDRVPTVDAVPISFIEKKIESIRQYLSEHEGEGFTSGLISKAIAYERLIEEWREENGQETD